MAGAMKPCYADILRPAIARREAASLNVRSGDGRASCPA